MRKLRISISTLLVIVGVAAALPLVGCSNPPSNTDNTSQGMIGGRGPDYNN